MSALAVVLLAAFLSLANACDIRSRRIPNLLTLSAVVLGMGGGFGGWWPWHWGWMGFAMGCLLLSGVGYGDVKAGAVLGGLAGWLIIPAICVAFISMFGVWHLWERGILRSYPGDWPFLPWLTVGLYGTLLLAWYL